MKSVLIVEDKDSLARMLLETMRSEGLNAEWIASGAEAIRRIRKGARYAAIVSDLRLPGATGAEVLREAKEADPDCPVIVMTGYGTIEDAVEAMKLGASDFIQKPVDIDYLVLLIRRGIERRSLRRQNMLLREDSGSRPRFPAIVGDSGAMLEVAKQVRRVAETDATVLLQGETGTGKELFARAIHELSARRDGPFVAINCAAIPDTLIENELFGHERGAFTGATGRQVGRFELADGGTVFLDEIGELGQSVQAKILRVLQDRTFDRIGGATPIEVDTRIVCATNRDLAKSVAEGVFRDDLYYRINTFPIVVPPLRSRRGDIDAIADHFVEKCGRELGRRGVRLSEEARVLLRDYDWPGNVRELENCIERALILADGDLIGPGDLRLSSRGARPEELLRQAFDLSGPLDAAVARVAAVVEAIRIREALERSASRGEAAEALGISPRALATKIKELGIEG
ncbi:MAG: sigma-54-dependent Fis family transcriptional regulator [Acidobacteria bacterium]|nr:sigma-54-dependent Fis family transcriptional regulator [Acidobacteriota bacterium]